MLFICFLRDWLNDFKIFNITLVFSFSHPLILYLLLTLLLYSLSHPLLTYLSFFDFDKHYWGFWQFYLQNDSAELSKHCFTRKLCLFRSLSFHPLPSIFFYSEIFNFKKCHYLDSYCTKFQFQNLAKTRILKTPFHNFFKQWWYF